MIAAIGTIPERVKLTQPLMSVLEDTCDKLHVFVDAKKRGQLFNFFRMMEYSLKEAAENEPVIICTDDAITIPSWRTKWEAVHEQAQCSVYSLYQTRKFYFTEENIARGYVINKKNWPGYYDQASVWINHHDFIPKLHKWMNERGSVVIPKRIWAGIEKGKQFDWVIQYYLNDNDIEYATTIPTLFNHQNWESSLGHCIGTSPMYIGHEDLLKAERIREST